MLTTYSLRDFHWLLYGLCQIRIIQVEILHDAPKQSLMVASNSVCSHGNLFDMYLAYDCIKVDWDHDMHMISMYFSAALMLI